VAELRRRLVQREGFLVVGLVPKEAASYAVRHKEHGFFDDCTQLL
jgi:hypothetical protein